MQLMFEGVLNTRFINMEADQNHKRSASCFPQLEPMQEEGRRNVKTAGKEDTTRKYGTAIYCEVLDVVSKSMIDMHRKIRICKALGEQPSAKRENSVVLRSNRASEGKVLQKSKTNNKLHLPVKTVTVPLKIPKRPMLQPPSSSTHVSMWKVLTNPSTTFRNLSGATLQSEADLMRPSSTVSTINEDSHHLNYQRLSCRMPSSCTRIFKTSGSKRQVSTEQ